MVKGFCNNEILDKYLRLYLLLYAVNTAVLAENREELQSALNGLHEYTEQWELGVNSTKTKIVIFPQGKVIILPDICLHVGDNKLSCI